MALRIFYYLHCITLPSWLLVCKTIKEFLTMKIQNSYSLLNVVIILLVAVLQECCICCEPLWKLSSYAMDEAAGPEVVKLSKCNHMLHRPCLVEMCKNDSQVSAIFINSLIQTIFIVPLQVHFYSEALPTQHGYCAGVSCRSATGNCEVRTCPRSLHGG